MQAVGAGAVERAKERPAGDIGAEVKGDCRVRGLAAHWRVVVWRNNAKTDAFRAGAVRIARRVLWPVREEDMIAGGDAAESERRSARLCGGAVQ